MTSECDYSEIARMPWRARSGYQFRTPLLTPFDRQQNSDSYRMRAYIMRKKIYVCSIWNLGKNIDADIIRTVIHIITQLNPLCSRTRENPIIPISFDSSIELYSAVDILSAVIISIIYVNQLPEDSASDINIDQIAAEKIHCKYV